MSYLFNPDLAIDAAGNVSLLATPSPGDSTTKIATTAFVANAISSGGTFNGAAVAITGGTINGTSLGITTPAAIKGTTGIFTGLLTLSGAGTALTVTNNATIGGILTMSGTGAFVFPTGTTAQQPDTGNAGEARYNSTTGKHEFGIGGSWVNYVRLTGDTMTGALIVNGGALTASAGINATGSGTGLTVTNNAAIGGTLAVTGITTTAGTVFGTRVVTVAGVITMANTDHVIIVNKTTGAATTVNLIASPPTGFFVTIKDGKGDAGTNSITIVPNAGTIDGASNVVLASNFASVDLIFSGAQWLLL